MRARSIRLSILILLLLGLALLSLGFKDINVDLPGFPELKRGGTGPLGLKLGLDLRGGAHLVYQADTGTRFDVTFLDPIFTQQVENALGELRFGEQQLAFENFAVDSLGASRIRIKTGLLDGNDPRRTEFQETMVEELGSIEAVTITDTDAPTVEEMEGALDTINRRVNLFGTEEPIIQRFGDDRIVVQLPGASGSVTEIGFLEPVPDVADEANAVEIVGSLLEAVGFDDVEVKRESDRTFRVNSATVGNLKREAARPALEERLGPVSRFQVSSGIDQAKALIGGTAQLEFKERTCTDVTCVQFTDADIGLTGDDLSRAYARTDQVGFGWVVIINFNDRGTEIFSDLTRKIVGQPGKRIAFFMDDEELLAPVAQAWIRDGVTRITGNFTREEARTLAIQLEAGRLPVPLKLIQENDVDALLGSESLRNSLIAGIVGLGLVIVFMLAYYRMAGVVAAVALVFYAIVVLAIFKLIPVTLTLSHIGGFILSIGMAVDANILIFERMKEEMRIGRTLASSMEVGFNRAWPAIRDGNVSTLFTCLVLLWFGDRLGGGLVTGFAISLGIGVLASMFTAVVLSRNLLQLLAWIGLGKNLGLFTPEGVPRTAQISGGGR
ncbi:MAG: protein translocase subunit SecD [Dehalococcoidia bacterium]|nr:protein translocase subunit SecD [Dehalococcoidia bacterium]MDP7200938.1 protein translocase subunit SecD [Dehalococcoidia bacterium]MDP7509557.1 protein translocase subunit SecD [Dehalococcoidia bacterium]HJN87696.1 protein translocase subunit SecD [Dehalococcoidia bacterium]